MEQAIGKKLRQDGYCIARNVFDSATIEKINRWCDQALESVTENHRIQFKAQGCLIDTADYPMFSEVIAHEALRNLFDEVGLHDAMFGSGLVVSKPPASPSLFWHQDWWGWDDLASYTERIAQVNVMIYMSATSPENGCLKVIPGSHRRRHEIHEIPVVYGAEMSRVDNPDHPLYQPRRDECAVAVQPGDVVIKDTRLLHSTYPNMSNRDRTMLSLNFNPGFADLPPRMRARITSVFRRERGKINGLDIPLGLTMAEWPEEHRKRVEHLFPSCEEGVLPQDFNFSPDPELFEQVYALS